MNHTDWWARVVQARTERENLLPPRVSAITHGIVGSGTVSRIAVAFFACVFAFASPASPCRCGSGPAFGAYAASDRCSSDGWSEDGRSARRDSPFRLFGFGYSTHSRAR